MIPCFRGATSPYIDTQLSRLGGPNYEQIPVNAPRCPMANMQRDGHMTMIPQKGRVSYSPSSLESNSPRARPGEWVCILPCLGTGRQAAHPGRILRGSFLPGVDVFQLPNRI